MSLMAQAHLFEPGSLTLQVEPLKGQLLKWVGNKQRVAPQIASYFPNSFNSYHEPFLGSGAVLATVAPRIGFGSDSFAPLMEIWKTLRRRPEVVKKWYSERWHLMMSGDKVEVYEEIKASYNHSPNGADLLFLCRSAYGGVVRFRKTDGYMSTPCGAHAPITPSAFAQRVEQWRMRLLGTTFDLLPYCEAMARAQPGDLVYCDPPYSHSQTILYGAQGFKLEHLFEIIGCCKSRGVFVALSIDGTKKSGTQSCSLPIPKGLFPREIFVGTGRSMLRRFQLGGETLEGEHVTDRLLLTY